MTISDPEVSSMTTPLDTVERITAYLASGGLFNPELADHAAVRDLLIDCRDAITAKDSELAEARAALEGCQRALAMMIAPDAIKQTTVVNAFAAATEAEARARTVLSREKEAG